MRLRSLIFITALLLNVAFAQEKKPTKRDKKAPPAASETTETPAPTETVPPRFVDGDLDGSNPEFLEKFFIHAVFPYKIAMTEGKNSDGKILVLQKDNSMLIAFYRAEGNAYTLLDKPAMMNTIIAPRLDNHPDGDVACLVVKRPNSNEAWRVFIRGGKVITENFTDETIVK